MIVVIHFLGHNILDFTNPVQLGEPNFYSSTILFSLCVCAVDCFVLISGYYGIRFSVKKIFLFLAPICLYQLILSLVFYTFHHNISISPFKYWFVGPYLLLLLVSPILNEGLKMVPQRKTWLIIVLCIVFFVLPVKSILGEAGKNFSTFVILYLIGYCLKNGNILKIKGIYNFLLFLFFVFLIFVETLLLAKTGKNMGTVTMSYNYDNILVVAAAVFLFKTFEIIQFQSKIINWISVSSFFVYIISENENMYSHPGLYDFLHVKEWSINPCYILLVLASSLCIFVLCIGIDKLRRLLFGHIENKLGVWISEHIDNKISSN